MPKPKQQLTTAIQLADRNRAEDLLKVCDMIIDSLERMTDTYDHYGQDAKRPFGNSGGPEYDILEELDIKDNRCPHCDERLSDDGLAYARALWAEAGDRIQTFWAAARARGCAD
jgi:hypothetical protein